MRTIYLRISVLFLLLAGATSDMYATHIRAGEIIARLVSCQSLTYEFTIIGYEDTGSDVEFGNGEVYFGFGNPVNLDTENDFFRRDIISGEDLIRKSTFVITRTFPGPGEYTITFREFNRNADILNMANSVNTPFYIETTLVIDPLLACNSSPELLVPPVDKGCTGKRYVHNPGAYDPDGDSLAYRFTIPKQDRDKAVDAYQYPDDYDVNSGANPDPIKQDGSFPPTLTLDSITGDLVWDAPANKGEYNIAFVIEEWRYIEGKWVQLGEVTRDMQILVEECDNDPPILAIPADTCVEAGSLLAAMVSAEDPDDDDIVLQAFGGVFEQASSPATFTPDPPIAQPSPASGEFQWLTDCSHIRTRPYQIEFKASDVPESGPPLADIKTWNVFVVGPAPTGLAATPSDERSVDLAWDDYLCEAQADRIQIWRRVESFPFEPDNCQTGIPADGEYELVAEVDAGVVSFTDDNDEEGLNPGATYCYRLVAVFPLPNGGESFASQEACAQVPANGPIITKVSITNTDIEDGQIDISWMGPFEIDSTEYPPPYSYEVLRATGFSGEDGLQLVSQRSEDTTFTDQGLNTADVVHNYRIVLFDATGTAIDTSGVASSVRLAPTPLVGAVELNWRAEVPWSNNTEAYPYHYIYRNRVDGNDPGALVLIDSVNVNTDGFSYTDDGSVTGEGPLSDQLVYCYYITTQGSYGHQGIVAPLLNNSQVVCTQPNDTIPPCQPMAVAIPNAEISDCEEILADKPCDFAEFTNTITWQRDPSDCDDDVGSYNIYFSFDEEGTFERIATVSDTFYVDGPLASFAGCYRVSAVDRSGNESELSEPVCNDNCPNYELPNVFTPNEDGYNDVFRAYDRPLEKCPRFVENVKFTVYNRWGKAIHTYESGGERSIFINWDGRTEDGQLVSPGVYYYTADVKFIYLDPNRGARQFKGWVQVLY